MRKCRECDFPKKFAKFFDWRSDGTIVSTDRTKTRSQITFLEAAELDGLFTDLSGTIGMNIDRFLIQAQKNIGKALYANLPIRHMKRVPTTRWLRPQWLARLLVSAIATDIAGLGDGRVRLDSYEAGKTLVLRFRNAIIAPILTGSAAGIYESIEEMPSAHVEYGFEASELVIRLSHGTATEVEETGRLYLDEIKPGNGPVSYERCCQCNVPLEAARAFKWDIEHGIITNITTGQRDVVFAVQSLNAILRELTSEIGEELTQLVYDHQKAYTGRALADARVEEPGAFVEDRLKDMALRGLGYPTASEFSGNELSVEIGNAYNQVLYAAKLAAAFEKATGGASAIEWRTKEPDKGAYVIREV